MLRRAVPLTSLVAALLFAVPLAQPAAQDAPVVRVRVEGKTATIFGATQPRARAATALEALESASAAGEFYYRVQQTDFGPYVAQIGRYAGEGSGGWVFKVNGASPPVGADKVGLRAGDVVLWYWATFTDAGGPLTLQLARAPHGCYSVLATTDGGIAKTPSATLRVDGRRVRMAGARACPGPHRGLVRATAPGMVRSNALP